MSQCLRMMAMLCLCCVMLAGFIAPAKGQSQGLRPQRLVHYFDFEEARLGNFEKLPQHWYVIGRPAFNADPNFMRITLHEELINRPGYPQFTPVEFDRPQHQSGPHAFLMKLDGGNAGAFLEVGAVTAVPMSDYLISARVQTAGLKRASARITAYLVDGQGKKIEASQARSPEIRSEAGWQTVSVHLIGEFPTAAWIGLELELLQPHQDPESPLGREQIVLQDIHGHALWDDIAIWQLPQVSIGTQNKVNIIRDPQRPELQVSVRDLTGQSLTAEMTVYDATGKVVDRARRSSGSGQSSRWTWSPRLQRYGWYVADLSVFDNVESQEKLLPGALASQTTTFLWLPASQVMDETEHKRFSLLATDIPADQLVLMPRILQLSGIGSTTLSLWDSSTTLATLGQRQQLLDQSINPILMQGGSVALSIHPAPTDLLRKLDLSDRGVLSLWSADRSIWQPYMLSLLMRHGQSVGLWNLGLGETALDPLMKELPSQSDAAYRGLQSMVPNPRIVLPWTITFPRRSDLTVPVVYQLDVPVAVQAEQLPLYLERWNRKPAAEHMLVLREPTPAEMSHENRLIDLTLRMLHAWEAGTGGLAIDKPWAWASKRHQTLMPDSLLGAFAQISQRLAGRRAMGRLDIGPGLECIIFDGPAGGMLAMWNRASPQNHVELFLGRAPELVDLWGNRQTLTLMGGRHHVPLSRQPVFIEGIDARLSLLRAGFKLNDPFIDSTQTPHRRVLTLSNPWARTITGQLQIVGPEKWRITPGQMNFSIPPGQTIELPVQMVFPVSEVAGYKRLEARVDFMADQPYQADVYAAMELGLRNIQFDASLSYQRGKQAGQVNAVVTQFITNLGDKPVSLYAFAQTAGFARQEGIVSRLNPGQSIIRRFVFEDVHSQGPLDQPMRVGVRETRGPAVLNQVLRLIPPTTDGQVSRR